MTDLFDRPPVQHQPPSRATRSGNRDRRAAKKRAQRRRRRTLIVVLALVLVGGAGYYLVNNASSLLGFENPFSASDYEGQGVDPVDVTIEPQSTGADMGQTLVEAGVVKSANAFVKAFKANPDAGKIQPGNYTMLTEMKASAAVTLLLAKTSKNEMKLTVPEGFTAAQVIERAVSVTGKSQEEFQAAMADPAAVGLPAEAGGNFEGWFFPSTYVLEPNDSAATIVANMIATTVANLDSLGIQPADRQTVLVKASLIEREAKAEEDRPKMAQAIENRLTREMTLDIDAAVAFGLGKPGTEITNADKANTDNLYNLYRHKGLPPGPIASPGMKSIEAVLNPEPGDWIFWVAVNLDTGETKFSSTLPEHQKYVDELRAWQKENP
ncbi:endolytic transglycosylase MltG [Oerskovia turbata]|uniref:Endolytic murein transglycosylase n=1 Tax=Oerskovia turbata TaxID=1713 RepID=A0A4V1N5A6_9CELL|nr:endolytic transglycosylase MltG [Oerskovia turbata]RXR24800.1 endolytic transglycosylase MltG [Oerskovia turbata]RXR34996.1 endolytic transglycosylase MltG [Oerskovia turbata]TGJ97056.1 endolytic transglycosylase MltG [Actinotalea fermentans ATCC 43279 = JCM 9966 = DSM 3133]